MEGFVGLTGDVGSCGGGSLGEGRVWEEAGGGGEEEDEEEGDWGSSG